MTIYESSPSIVQSTRGNPNNNDGKSVSYMTWCTLYVYNIVPFGSETHSSALEPFKKRILLSMCAPVCLCVSECLCTYVRSKVWVYVCSLVAVECVCVCVFRYVRIVFYPCHFGCVCIHAEAYARVPTETRTFVCQYIRIYSQSFSFLLSLFLHFATSHSSYSLCHIAVYVWFILCSTFDMLLLLLTLFLSGVCAFFCFFFFSFSFLLFLGFVTYTIHAYLHLFSLLWKHVLLNCFKWLACHGLFQIFFKNYSNKMLWCAANTSERRNRNKSGKNGEKKVHWMVGLLLGMFYTMSYYSPVVMHVSHYIISGQ